MKVGRRGMGVVSPRLLIAGLLIAGVALGPRPLGARVAELQERLVRLHAELNAWDLQPVANALDELLAAYGDDAGVKLLAARYLLMTRDFPGAVAALDGLCGEDAEPQVAQICSIASGSAEVTGDFKSTPSSGGHFVFHYLPGPDAVLIPYADETMEMAYRNLGVIFRYFPKEPVHIDIVPRVEDLARMTPLTAEDIEGSGTIAMCKYHRLMVVSPRDLVYGYGWRDTLAHEYVHFLLTSRSRNRVPLWLHEGLAKFFEGFWRDGASPSMDPLLEHRIAEGVRRHKLISLDRLNPSIGKLPTQEAAALAFAEVYSLVEMFYQRLGADGLERLLAGLSAGHTLDDSLQSVFGERFRGIRREWRKWLKKRGYRRIPRAVFSRMLFRGSDRPEDELETIEEERGRDLTYLGDLLRAREHPLAALEEYRKAVRVVGATSPVLQSKIAAAESALGRYEDVLKTVDRVLQSYPGHVLLHLYRGEALLRLGRPGEAALSLRAAIDLNPFDVGVHELLAEAYASEGQAESAAFERRQQALVQR